MEGASRLIGLGGLPLNVGRLTFTPQAEPEDQRVTVAIEWALT